MCSGLPRSQRSEGRYRDEVSYLTLPVGVREYNFHENTFRSARHVQRCQRSCSKFSLKRDEPRWNGYSTDCAPAIKVGMTPEGIAAAITCSAVAWTSTSQRVDERVKIRDTDCLTWVVDYEGRTAAGVVRFQTQKV